MSAPLLLSLLAATALLAACTPESDQPEAAADPALATDTTSTLTPQQQADGWRMLFDGQSLAGWHGYKRADVPSGWTADAGTIHFTPGSEGGDLVTDESFSDFELALEWKIQACGNSGIMYRGDESRDAVWHSAVEYQVLDNTCHPDAATPSHTAGAVYDLYVPTEDATRPAGEWNQTRIVANGPHVEHWLNGVKVAEYDQDSDEWKSRLAASKFNGMEGFGMRADGIIALQDHGDNVWYRNIKIRPL